MVTSVMWRIWYVIIRWFDEYVWWRLMGKFNKVGSCVCYFYIVRYRNIVYVCNTIRMYINLYRIKRKGVLLPVVAGAAAARYTNKST